MFRQHPIQRKSREFIDALQASAHMGVYSPLTSSIIGRLIAPDVSINFETSGETAHFYKPKGWGDHSVALAVSSVALRHAFARKLVAQSEEQILRTHSLIDFPLKKTPEGFAGLYDENALPQPGFDSPLEVVIFTENALMKDRKTSISVCNRPVVLVDEASVASRALTPHDIETMAHDINDALIMPAKQPGART